MLSKFQELCPTWKTVQATQLLKEASSREDPQQPSGQPPAKQAEVGTAEDLWNKLRQPDTCAPQATPKSNSGASASAVVTFHHARLVSLSVSSLSRAYSTGKSDGSVPTQG